MTNETTLTPQQEHFCRALVETGLQSEAYRQAYNVREDTKRSSIWSSASGLMTQPKIRTRVEELQAELGRNTLASAETVLQELEAARLSAMDAGNLKEEIAAIMGKAKILGLGNEKANGSADKAGAPVEHITRVILEGVEPDPNRFKDEDDE